MSAFEIVHQDRVTGKLTCFDRLIFKGHLANFNMPGRMKAFLDHQGVLLKHFDRYVSTASAKLKDHTKSLAASAGRPYLYLAETHTKSRGQSKEELARQIATRDGIVAGLICVLAAVEPCSSFAIYKNRDTHRLELVRRRRKCLHFYFYWIHPELGFCHVRLQSWFPFEVQVWVNGREALSRQLDRRGVGHLRWANAIVKAANWVLAQRLAERLATRRWPRLLNGLARQVNPMLATVQEAGFGGYWWVVDQAEVATDIAFSSRQALEAVLPGLVAHAATAFSAEDVLRFLGRKLHPALAAEVTSDARRRPEGWRIKHCMARNSIKVYDKANVLRVETTINDPTRFRVLRVKDGHRVWCPMRKGVANLPRYTRSAARPTSATSTPWPPPMTTEPASPCSTVIAAPSPTGDDDTLASTPSAPTIWPCSGPPWPASTPSSGSATRISPDGSTPNLPPTTPKPAGAANEPAA
jgi:hypothetical protein